MNGHFIRGDLLCMASFLPSYEAESTKDECERKVTLLETPLTLNDFDPCLVQSALVCVKAVELRLDSFFEKTLWTRLPDDGYNWSLMIAASYLIELPLESEKAIDICDELHFDDYFKIDWDTMLQFTSITERVNFTSVVAPIECAIELFETKKLYENSLDLFVIKGKMTEAALSAPIVPIGILEMFNLSWSHMILNSIENTLMLSLEMPSIELVSAVGSLFGELSSNSCQATVSSKTSAYRSSRISFN